MGVRTAVKAFVILIFPFFLSVCGDLMLFPSNGSYQIKATVNGYSLEECSLIRAEDQIRPYFAVSVAKDPDLTALLVYLRSPKGVQIGEKVRYTIDLFSEETDPPAVNAAGDPVEEENESSDGEGEEGSPDTSILDLIEQAGPREAWSFTGNRTTGETTDLVIKVSSFDKDLPYFPLPEKLESGSYTLVFEAVGGRNILSRSETEIFYLGNVEFYLKDISVYLPGVSSSRLISPGALIMLEAGLNYDSRLDPYVIWYNGKNIISEGRIKDGAGNILRTMPEQAEFYSVRLEVLPFPLKPLTGYSREITLTVSPKAVNAGYFFTDGPQFAAYHSLAQGTVFPEQVKPAAAELNISATVAAAAAPPDPPTLLHLYQFGGSMHDSAFPLQTESDLTPVFDKPPKWVTVGQSFGLSTGPADSYFLPPISFFRETPEQGGGIFLLHVKPAEGVIFNAFFPFRASPSEGVTMEMTATENSVVLRLSTAGGNDTKLYLYPAPSARRTYIPVAVEFFFRPYRLEARISMGETPHQSVTGSLKLSNIIAGEGRIRLGGETNGTSGVVVTAWAANPEIEKIPNPENTNSGSTAFFQNELFAENPFPEITGEVSEKAGEPESAPAAVTTMPESPVETERNVVSSVTVWNEFAVLYSQWVLLPEEDVITENSEDTESENKEEQKQIPVNNPADTVTLMKAQTEPEDIPIAADQDESDLEILTSSEEETRVFADHQEDFPLPTDELETTEESEYSSEDWEYSVDYSADISRDL